MKKRCMLILDTCCYESKFSQSGWTQKIKKWRMRILGARIFLSFLAGKLKILTRVTMKVNSAKTTLNKQENRKRNKLIYKFWFQGNIFFKKILMPDFEQTRQFILKLVGKKITKTCDS